jgi:membrane-associated phospholipid phosphatase
VEKRRIAAALDVAGAVLCARARRRLGLPPAVATAGLFAAPVALARALPRSPYRDAAVWTAQMLAYKNAFEIPNDDPDRLRARARIHYPVAFDTCVGGGTPPGQRLQRRLRRRGHLSPLDKALTFFYWTWELEPHAALAWIRWHHPERFAAAAGRLATVFDLTLVGYWVVPTAPPWWASEQAGEMDGQVHRVMVEVAKWVQRKPHPAEGDHKVGANPFAAMPSDHFASAAMTAILLAEIDPRRGALGWAYALLLALTLLYLGEHYTLDLLAGLALTLSVNGLRSPLESAARRWLDGGEGPATLNPHLGEADRA